MSDFESTFGAGADIDSVISSINYWNDKEHEEESTRYYGEILKKGYVYFRSYEKASTWSKINNGETFIACGAGYRSKEKLKDSKKYNFFEVKDEESPHFYCSIITNSKKTTY